MYLTCLICGPVNVVGVATGYGLDGPRIESLCGARFSAPVQTGPGAHPASCTMGTGSLPVIRSSWGVTLTPHPLLVPWSWKSRAIPLFPVWAVLPIHSLSACTRVSFTLPYLTLPCLTRHMSGFRFIGVPIRNLGLFPGNGVVIEGWIFRIIWCRYFLHPSQGTSLFFPTVGVFSYPSITNLVFLLSAGFPVCGRNCRT
jgi:hypothetical protein